MTSWQMAAVAAYMRLTRKRVYADPDGGRTLLERAKADPAPPRAVRRRMRITDAEVRGFDVPSVTRSGSAPGEGPLVVYLHGGAYVNEIAPQHWSLVADVADWLDVEVAVPVYGLAPRFDAREAHALVDEVVARATSAGRRVQLVGDSSGGGLALAAAQRIGRHEPLVVGLTLLAPWLDVRMTNPDIPAMERVDPWLARAALHEVARAWAAGLLLDDPRVSPLLGPMEGLPPVDLWVGTRDITLPDCRLLHERLVAAGVDVHHTEAAEALHVFPILPVPEAKAARAAMITRIGQRADG